MVDGDPRRLEYVPLDDLVPALRNAKGHDADAIGGPIGQFGFMDMPIIDERTGRLVGGHGRREDLLHRRSAGEGAPEGIVVDGDGRWLVPVVRGWASRSDTDADAAALALNRAGERGGWDQPMLDEILGDLARHDFDLALVAGWDSTALEAILAQDDPVKELDDVPSTDAAYSEDPEDEAARQARFDEFEVKAAQGLVEMILVFTEEERAEVGRLLAALRVEWGDTDRVLKASEVILRVLRERAGALVIADAAG